MSDVKIQALDNGPYKVTGEVEIVDGNGDTVDTKSECYLCRCGMSTNAPYCTGAHNGRFKNIVRNK